MDGEYQVGRVLRSSTAAFTVGCRQLIVEQDKMTPKLGALLKAQGAGDRLVYGMTCNVTIEDDAFVRQLVAAGVDTAEIIEDQRQKRQVPIVVDVMIVGHGEGFKCYHRLPPQPPRTLDEISTCGNAEVVRFTQEHDWMRLVLASLDAAVDQILVAALRLARDARPSDAERRDYLIGVGRELAKLLSLDLARLDGILRQLR